MATFAGVDFSGIGAGLSNVGTSIGIILLLFFIILIGGGATFYFYKSKADKKNYNHVVNLFKFVSGKRFHVGSDVAREIVVPGTNIRLLHWKRRNIYSSYPTRAIGPNVYGYMINRVGELTNFDLDAGEDPTEAKIDYDHRDQTYAFLNLQEFINRNYKNRDKISWWQQNLPLITIIVCAILLGLEMWFFFSQSGKQLQQWSIISTNMKDAAQQIANAVIQTKNMGAGVVAT